MCRRASLPRLWLDVARVQADETVHPYVRAYAG